MEIFLYCAIFGIFAGCIYLLLLFFRRIFNNNIIVTIVLDIFWGICAGYLFGYCIFKYNNGIIRLYELIAFTIGIAIVLISIGNLVAKVSNFVYNKVIIKLISVSKRKKTKGVQHGNGEVNSIS